MGFFEKELLNVIEWKNENSNELFWKWHNDEIKKGSRLVIRPGQDAIFLYNGRIEGIFKDEGNYEIETQIIPFLSTLKGFKFGFNSGMRAEVVFINTKEITVKWGTKNTINIPAPGMPGGMPIRSFGSFAIKLDDYVAFIDKVVGVQKSFTIDEVQQRVVAKLDQLLMKWISTAGKNMFDLMASSMDIGKGIQTDLDMEMMKIGLTITDFMISSFSYPDSVQKMIDKNAELGMIGDMSRYQQVGMIDSMVNNPNSGAGAMGQMGAQMAQASMGMAMGMEMAKQMSQTMNPTNQQANAPQVAAVPGGFKFCPSCGTKVEGMKFCGNCGQKLV